MTKKILVWLSGGVDSAVSAYLLQEAGYEVSAGFMINYLTDNDTCTTRADMAVAEEVAKYLNIPFFTFDFIEEYEKKVLQYIFDGYKKWLTPNPDVFCNTWIKFDLFREEAISYGYDMVATGHYARIQRQTTNINLQSSNDELRITNDENEKISHDFLLETENWKLKTENLQLLRGVDPEKDQSYFLSALSREQLQQAIFPIGHLHKKEVREIAKKAWLPNADRKDSQWLCFVGKVDFPSFLKEHIPAKKGNILDTAGNIIGEHDGAFQYTIGQRKGIWVGGWPARYVISKDVVNNTITVWEEDEKLLFRSSCVLGSMNWFVETSEDFSCTAQIRYRQTPQEARVVISGKGVEVLFSEPQRAVTPGQVCVLYDGQKVLGSGIILP